MRLSVDVHVFLDPALSSLIGARFDEVLKAISNLEKRDILMNDKLTAVVGGLTPRLAAIDTTLAAVLEFLNTGVTPIVAAAVAKALADEDVDEAAAADAVDAAVSDVEQHLQPIVDAIKAGTPDAGTPAVVEPAPVVEPTDTTTAGAGTDTVTADAGTGDSLSGGAATDTVATDTPPEVL